MANKKSNKSNDIKIKLAPIIMHYCKVELLFRNITVIRILQKKTS